jgi:hypothetical protein
MRIFEKPLSRSLGFSKIPDRVAPDFFKSAMQVPAIIRKDRHRAHLQNDRPTNNHHSPTMETFRVVRFFPKNVRAQGRGFSKNRDRVTKDFRKSVIESRRIF